MSEQQQPVFNIEKIYVKDLSVELPNAPQCFLEREQAQIGIQVASAGNAIGEGTYQVELTVTVTAKIGEKTQFLVEVAQAGIFIIQNIPEGDLEPILAIGCPNILFPYAREVVSDCVVRAGFPPVLLAPINFEAVYQQRANAAGQQAAAAEATLQ